MSSIINFLVSFIQNNIKKIGLPLLLFIIGHRLASKNAKIKEQQQNLQNNKVTITTLKKMQEAEANAPSDKQSLLQSLSKGDF